MCGTLQTEGHIRLTLMGCGAFPEMRQTWWPQIGGELESEDMVKLTERS